MSLLEPHVGPHGNMDHSTPDIEFENEQIPWVAPRRMRPGSSNGADDDPVVAADGHTYERVEIAKWIRLKGDIVKVAQDQREPGGHQIDSQPRAESQNRQGRRKRSV